MGMKEYEVMVSVACTVDAESEDEAKEMAESLVGELQAQHGLKVNFQVGEAARLDADEDEDDVRVGGRQV